MLTKLPDILNLDSNVPMQSKTIPFHKKNSQPRQNIKIIISIHYFIFGFGHHGTLEIPDISQPKLWLHIMALINM